MGFRATSSKITYEGIKSLIQNIGKHCVNKAVVPQMTWRMLSKYFIIHSLKYQAKPRKFSIMYLTKIHLDRQFNQMTVPLGSELLFELGHTRV